MRASHRPALALAAALAIAMPSCSGCGAGGPGAGCTATADCRGGLECIANARGGTQCMAPCDEGTWHCDDGAACLETPAAGRVCWFGGTTSYAAPCADALECEPGTACERGLCLQVCSVARTVVEDGVERNPVCDQRWRCTAIAVGADDGVCVPPEPEVDGGVTSP